MLAKIVSGLLVLLPLIAVAQEGSTLTVYSDNHEKFILVLDGKKQGKVPRDEVKLTGLTKPVYDGEIIFEDKSLPVLEADMRVTSPAGAKSDAYYNIRRTLDGIIELHFLSVVPINDKYLTNEGMYAHKGYGQFISYTAPISTKKKTSTAVVNGKTITTTTTSTDFDTTGPLIQNKDVKYVDPTKQLVTGHTVTASTTDARGNVMTATSQRLRPTDSYTGETATSSYRQVPVAIATTTTTHRTTTTTGTMTVQPATEGTTINVAAEPPVNTAPFTREYKIVQLPGEQPMKRQVLDENVDANYSKTISTNYPDAGAVDAATATAAIDAEKTTVVEGASNGSYRQGERISYHPVKSVAPPPSNTTNTDVYTSTYAAPEYPASAVTQTTNGTGTSAAAAAPATAQYVPANASTADQPAKRMSDTRSLAHTLYGSADNTSAPPKNENSVAESKHSRFIKKVFNSVSSSNDEKSSVPPPAATVDTTIENGKMIIMKPATFADNNLPTPPAASTTTTSTTTTSTTTMSPATSGAQRSYYTNAQATKNEDDIRNGTSSNTLAYSNENTIRSRTSTPYVSSSNYEGYNADGTRRINNSPCANPIDVPSFAEAKNTIGSLPDDDTKVSAAMMLENTYCFTAQQIFEMCMLLGADDSKLSFAKDSFAKTIDPGNYFKVYNALQSDLARKELKDYVNSKR